MTSSAAPKLQHTGLGWAHAAPTERKPPSIPSLLAFHFLAQHVFQGQESHTPPTDLGLAFNLDRSSKDHSNSYILFSLQLQ